MISSRPKTEEEEMEDIQQLLGMGFEEEKVLAVYYEANRDVRMAAHKLVELSFGPSAWSILTQKMHEMVLLQLQWSLKTFWQFKNFNSNNKSLYMTLHMTNLIWKILLS